VSCLWPADAYRHRPQVVAIFRFPCGVLSPESILRIGNASVYKNNMLIYNRIAVLRAERSLSRAQLAETVGVNPQTIGFLERGNYTPSLELAFKISRFFRLPMEAVFSPDPFRPLSEQVYTLEKKEA